MPLTILTPSSHQDSSKMSTLENQPLNTIELEILATIEKEIGCEELYSKLSATFLVQAIRGWETESPRLEITMKNIKNIMEFRERSDCKYWLGIGGGGRKEGKFEENYAVKLPEY